MHPHIRPLFRSSHAGTLVPMSAALLRTWLLVVVAGANSAAAADLAETANLFRTGKYAECIEQASQAIARDTYSEGDRLLKMRAELALGRYAEAVATYDEAVKRFPYSLPLHWLGRTACRFGGASERVSQIDAAIAQMVRQAPWRYGDAVSRVTLGRFLLSQGVDPKRVLDECYARVKKEQPTFADAWMAAGELALAKHDYKLAGDNFQQAIKLDASDADAQLGVARAFAPSDSERAEAALQTALGLNPKHIDSLFLLVDHKIDAEQYSDAADLLDQVKEINPKHPLAAAYRAVLAHLNNQPQSEAQHRLEALKPWEANPEVDHLIGRKLSQKYRFAEGAAYQRKALALDANYLPAKLQLAEDLLRLGQEDEAWELAASVYEADAYNVVAHNLQTLADSMARFRTLERDGFLVRMDAREAEIYGEHVLDLLSRAKQTLTAKYDVELAEPIVVELFPKQEDFAIRTFGLPGGAGFLGVCFGTVITANSPASQGETPANWEATLWHEFCHVVTLSKTKNKMPRWLSEGISVYEERVANPTWGQSLTPEYREMLLGPELTPVDELSGAFLNPKSPMHLQFAYYESSLVVEYLVEKHGLETLKRILVDLGVGMPINDSLARYTGSLEALNTEFTEYARKRAAAFAPEVDWSKPELPKRATVELAAEYVRQHPNNYQALQRWAELLLAAEKWQAAKEPLLAMRTLHPGDCSSDGPHALLAKVHRELNEPAEERVALEKVAELSADDLEAFGRLTELYLQAEEWKKARELAGRMLAVNPLRPAPHRAGARAAEELSDPERAIRSYKALLLLQPLDAAELHLKLATWLERESDLTAARRHALLALEETPRYRAAHHRLLSIVEKMVKEQSPKAPETNVEPAAQWEAEKPEPKEAVAQ